MYTAQGGVSSTGSQMESLQAKDENIYTLYDSDKDRIMDISIIIGWGFAAEFFF